MRSQGSEAGSGNMKLLKRYRLFVFIWIQLVTFSVNLNLKSFVGLSKLLVLVG